MANAYKIKLKEDKVQKIVDGHKAAIDMPYGIKREEAISRWVDAYVQEERVTQEMARKKLFQIYNKCKYPNSTYTGW